MILVEHRKGGTLVLNARQSRTFNLSCCQAKRFILKSPLNRICMQPARGDPVFYCPPLANLRHQSHTGQAAMEIKRLYRSGDFDLTREGVASTLPTRGSHPYPYPLALSFYARFPRNSLHNKNYTEAVLRQNSWLRPCCARFIDVHPVWQAAARHALKSL